MVKSAYSGHLWSLKKMSLYRFLSNFHGKYILRIRRVLDNFANSSRKNYCKTVDWRNLRNLIPAKYLK